MRLTVSLAISILVSGAAILPAQETHTKARLVLADEMAKPGDIVQAGIHLRMDPDWHIYWKNSGQGGLGFPPSVDWQLPRGVSAGEIQWPLPTRAIEKGPSGDLATYVYEGDVILLLTLKLEPDVKPGALMLRAKLDWLECGPKTCNPRGGTAEAALTVGTGIKPSVDAALLESWQKKLPVPGDGLAARASWEDPANSEKRAAIIEWSATQPADEVDFYPYASDDFEVQPATEKLPSVAGKLRLRVRVTRSGKDWPKEISGVLIQKSGSERKGYEVKLPCADSGPSVKTPAASNSGNAMPSDMPPLGKILLYAFIGGLILNVMPCVLPVIALKILGFVSEAGSEPRHVRKLGLIYTAGVLSSFLLLALIVVGLQTAGHGAGWGFQFGNPYFLLAMTTLVTLIALNLFGVFEVTLSSGTLSAASGLASKQGATGAFFNGLLATVLATSCSAPFLGIAVGFAFALKSAGMTLLVMLVVGLGMAAPYLLLSWNPAWLTFLPKPGLWMNRFKVAMGFPMIAAAVWLCSLLTVHYGERAWWMAVFLVVLAVAAWVFGEFVQRGSRHRGLAWGFVILLLVGGYTYALESHLEWRMPMKDNGGAAESPTIAPKGDVPWRKWSPEAVAEARAAGRPVVIDFTAKWCPTCNTIVKPAFESAAVQAKLKELNAVALIADYTRFSDDITAELGRFRRAAVPFILVYPRRSTEPPLEFNLVTSSTLLDALAEADKK